jgi:predicted dehydrogenase
LRKERHPVSIAVVGLGRWGLNYVRELQEHEGVRLAALVDTDPDARGRASALAPGASIHASLEEIDPSIEGIVIATPSVSHADLAIRALALDAFVLVEKPLATSRTDAQRVANAAAGRLLVGHLTVHHAVSRWLEQIVSSGAIGEIVSVTAKRSSTGAARSTEPAIWALGPHDVSSAVRLIRSPAVRVRGRSADSAQQGAALDVVFQNGAAAHLAFARTGSTERTLEVRGTSGAARVDEAAGRAWLELDGAWVEQPLPSGPSPLTAQIAHFVDCVRGEASPRSDADEGLAVVEILAAAHASATSGEAWVVELRAPMQRSRSPENVVLP